MQSAQDHSRTTSPSLLDFAPRPDDEDTTVTSKRFAHRKHKLDVLPPVPPMPAEEDLALLAVSAQMTEISYSISDIQTRIFEIQELRHRNLDDDVAAPKQDNGEGATNVIDQALINLDERLEAVSSSISAVDEALGITPGAEAKSSADPLLLRKHAALIEEWDSVQTEAETLRDELKEDKWLAVFRTVSEQAEGMMASLEKGVTQCHDFIFQFQRRAGDDHQSSISSGTAMHSDKSPINYETFTTLLQSFEAKKKYYMPSITKVLSVLDKGVRDRVTKNGECLRRHADLRARWHNLKERIGRTDAEMESVRRQLVNRDLEPSEAGSTTSRLTSKSRNGFLGASMSTLTSRSPSSAASRAPSSATRSTSPFNFSSGVKRLANRVSDKFAGRTTPSAMLTPPSSTGSVRIPSNDSPTTRKSSFFQFRSSSTLPPETPSRSHGHTQSVAASSAAAGKPSKERWNASTKVEAEPAGTVKVPALRKRPSAGNIAAAAGEGGSHFRSPSPANSAFGRSTPSGLGTLRAANASTSRLLNVTPSRPGSRSASLTIWTKNTPTKSAPATPADSTPSRPPRATTPNGTVIMRSHTPGGTKLPRARPTSPSRIPAPGGFASAASEVSDDDYEGFPTSMMQRAFSPQTPSRPSLGMRPTTPSQMRPRTPSNSLIPVPRLSLDSRSNTPDALTTLRGKPGTTPLKPGRPSFSSAAPSSFREGSSVASRPSSRASMFTPDQNPLPSYHPVRTDPLDVEVAKCVNGFPHSFIVERIDPALKAPPKNLEEIRAQYAVSNALARKIITCRLVIISRSKSKGPSVSAIADSGEQRKVMCRVGGGWLDLQMYLLNRQAGMA